MAPPYQRMWERKKVDSGKNIQCLKEMGKEKGRTLRNTEKKVLELGTSVASLSPVTTPQSLRSPTQKVFSPQRPIPLAEGM